MEGEAVKAIIVKYEFVIMGLIALAVGALAWWGM